jgi:hypothetical protein
MILTNNCGSALNKSNNTNESSFDIIAFCRYQSQIKALSQKNNKKMNTSGNDTQISNAMRYSQIVR